MTELAGSLSKMSLAELSQLQKFANQPDATNFQVSHALGAIIDNTGKPYDVITRLGFDAGSISAAESSRNCRRVSSWRMFVGKFLPKVLNIIETESDVVAQNKARIGSLENMPVACVTCERGLARKGSGKHAVCPLGQSFAERMIDKYNIVKGNVMDSLGLVYNNSGILESRNSVELPNTETFHVRVGNDVYEDRAEVLFSSNSYDKAEYRKEVVASLYAINPDSEAGNAVDRNTYMTKISGFKVGPLVIRGYRTSEDTAIANLAAREMGILNFNGIPFEHRFQPNNGYALQCLNLLERTIHLKNLPNAVVSDIGSGKGTLGCLCVSKLSHPSKLNLLEYKADRLQGYKELMNANLITIPVEGQLGDIRDNKNSLAGATHAVINFGKSYEKVIKDDKGSIFDAIVQSIENSKTLQYVLLGGFEEGESILSLTDKEFARLKAKGYTLAATSKSVPKKGLPKTAYVFTRDI